MQKTLSEAERSQEIARWTRIYAQNRSLGVIANMLIFVVVSAGISIPSYVGGNAYRSHNLPLFWCCLAVTICFSVICIYISIPQLGGKRLGALESHLYSEGNVSIAILNEKRRKSLMIMSGIGFGICILISVMLGLFDLISEKYMQPVAALYCVPFLIGLIYLQWPKSSLVMLIWPILFGLHAVLIVAGVPIWFTTPLSVLNMLIPTTGYGLIAALASHAYNRWALHKIKQLSGPTTLKGAPKQESTE